MEKVTEFLNHANECLVMAAKARDQNLRSELATMASHWQQLAVERQEMLSRPQTGE